jgi:uncharacterized protein (TIGR03790 family)
MLLYACGRMFPSQPRFLSLPGILLALNCLPGNGLAGGSGLNTLVVINQNSARSMELGNYYCERRQIPPENVIRIVWTGGNTTWTATEFHTILRQPVEQAIASRGLSAQIEFVVLSMDIPFSVGSDALNNGTTSALFYGVKSNAAPGSLVQTNSYFASEAAFAQAKPAAAAHGSFLTTMLTAPDLTQAKRLVDQGVDSDATFPQAFVHLAKSTDPLRRIRHPAFDNTIFNTRLRGDYLVLRTNSNSPYGLTGLLGYQNGFVNFSISPNTFVPGAMADSLTSFGGVIFGPNDQTSLLAFIGAGAAGSYGTVSEPTANTAKFPSPQNYFYQARGFTLAECYYQSLYVPLQGLIVGEPLAAPFAQPGVTAWLTPASNAVLSGTSSLSLNLAAADPTRPIQQVDLFVDGKFFQTLTNITPTAGNRLRVRLADQDLSHEVPANATLGSIAAGIAAQINQPAITNLTKTVAQAFGDRIELRSQVGARLAAPTALRIGSPGGPVAPAGDGPRFTSEAGNAMQLTTFLSAARATFMNSSAAGMRACTVNGTAGVGTWLRLTVTKTNGVTVTVTATNQTPGGAVASVVSNLVQLINAEPALQGPDGLLAEDFTTAYSTHAFNLVARRPGLAAANITVKLSSSGTLVGDPGSPAALNENWRDLQPRNHLYVTAGADELRLNYTFDTTAWPDGEHQLTAVAYEGSHVRTQTRASVPIRIQNTALTASLDLAGLAATNPVAGNYPVYVSAQPTNITSITLYSTGGALATVPNQSHAAFTVSGAALGAGTHPFYAVVQDAAGRRYRTATHWRRFVNP